MPPRLELLQRLGTVNLCLRPSTRPPTQNFLPIAQAANLSLRERKQKAKQDPYKWAQAQQRKAANLKRREQLEGERKAQWGHPVHGKTTPFLESLDSAGQDVPNSHQAASTGVDQPVEAENSPSLPESESESESLVAAAAALSATPGLRNHFLTDAELEDAARHAYTLTKPLVGVIQQGIEQTTDEELLTKHEQKHEKALEALRRITSLSNASARDRFHANVRRIVDEFGRHNTDKVLKPRPQSIAPNTQAKTERAGPDTGSSEVQIAILTTKIRALSQALEINRGYKDKHNKRNLRLLVHRRQKLLKYMERKERGSERWTNMLEKLGLTPATWKGQIDV